MGRRCEEVPGMWKATYNTDTMRSYKSVGSIKSVQISNRVTEFHYSDSENGADRTMNDDNQDMLEIAMISMMIEQILELMKKQLVLMTGYLCHHQFIKLTDKKNTFTKDQIIDLYCAANQNMDR